MKIGLITHELGLSGAPRALLNLAKCLKNKGHDIIIYSPFNGPLIEEFTINFIDIKIINGLLCGHVEGIDTNCDIIILNTIVTLAIAEKLQDIRGRKIVWVHEGTVAYDLFSTSTISYGLNRALNFPHLFNLVDEIYCVSEYSKKVTCKYTNQHIGILPYYIDNIDTNRERTTNKKLTIGFVGSVEKRKGIHLLDKALKLLPKNIQTQIQIVAVGSVVEFINNPIITYIGRQTHETIMELYNQFDLLICPSLDDPMPITCAEALMVGCPVFCSNNCGTASLITSTKDGYTFNANEKAIAFAIKWALKNKSKLKDIGEAGKEIYLNNFSYDEFVFKIEELLNGNLYLHT